jgi:hypothetical protein
VRRADNLPPSCTDCLEILGASTSWNPNNLSRPAKRQRYLLHTYTYGGRGVPQIRQSGLWLPTVGPQVQSRVTACEIPGGRSGTGARLSQSFFGFPLLIISSTSFHIPHQEPHYHILSLWGGDFTAHPVLGSHTARNLSYLVTYTRGVQNATPAHYWCSTQ